MNINLSTLAKQDATNDLSGIYLYEHPETGEYVWFEDLPDYVVDDMRIITKAQKLHSEQLALKWGQTVFIYLIPESSNPQLLRIDAWDQYKWQIINGAHLVATIDGGGWILRDSEQFALENGNNIELSK